MSESPLSHSGSQNPNHQVFSSLRNLNNKYIDDYANKKSEARAIILEKGVAALKPGYLNKYAHGAPSNYRKPTALSIFPHIGMWPNKDIYVSHNT